MKLRIKFILILIVFSSCKSLSNSDMVILNDPDMGFQNNSGKNMENYIESIREGSQSTGGGKASGGCGCN